VSRASALRWCVCLAVALGLHLAFYRALGTGSPAAAESESIPTGEAAITMVTAETDERPRPVRPPDERPPEANSSHVPRGAVASPPTSRTGALGVATVRVESSRRGTSPSSRESPLAGGDGDWSLPVTGMGDVTSREFIARALPRPSAGPDDSGGFLQTGGITEALDAHDTAIGMTRAGPLLTVLENAVGGTAAPFEGIATFDVGVDTDGNVYATMLESNGDAEGWRQVAGAARAAVDPKRVRIPPHARGWHAIVKVEAKVEYPNALDPKKLGTKVEASPTAVTLASIGKVCSVRITLGLTLVPILGGCDPSNIGAHTLRVVHGSIVSEGRF
jgi:hypothetical protein